MRSVSETVQVKIVMFRVWDKCQVKSYIVLWRHRNKAALCPSVRPSVCHALLSLAPYTFHRALVHPTALLKYIKYRTFYRDSKKEEIWLGPMTKAFIPSENERQETTTRHHQKISITERLRTDLETWHYYCLPTGMVNPVNEISAFPLTTSRAMKRHAFKNE